ncbi:MAG: CCA tRNA nucleotidyltransferase [Hyphomicrobiales bacterium]
MKRASFLDLPSLEGAAWLADPHLQAVFDALGAQGGEVRIAGGAVRNALMKLPVSEIDLATTEPPERTMVLAKSADLDVYPTGLDHGTVTVVCDFEGERRGYEVTTLRVDTRTDGRHAEVTFTADWRQDAARRDFTINALYCARDGTVYDPLGGYGDIVARKVRFVGDPASRIREDSLRSLRFFRMHARYAVGRLDEEGLAACVAEQARLERLSGERICAEFLDLLMAPGACGVVKTMIETAIMARILPLEADFAALPALVDIETALARKPDGLLRLFALTPVGGPDLEKLQTRLRLSRVETRRIAQLERLKTLTPSLPEGRRKAMLYHVGAEIFADSVVMNWARSHAAAHDKGWRALHALGRQWRAPRFPVCAADLMARGVAAGPLLGHLLKELEEWWIASGFHHDKESLLAQLDRIDMDRNKLS